MILIAPLYWIIILFLPKSLSFHPKLITTRHGIRPHQLASIPSAKRIPTIGDYYYDDDYEEENDQYNYYETTYRREDRSVRNIPIEGEINFNDIEESVQFSLERDTTIPPPVPRQRRDDYYETEDEEEETDPPEENFWSNPKRGLDLYPNASPPDNNMNTLRPRKTRPPPTKRATFRSGAPPPPPAIKDLYNKLFWYGFDPTDTEPNGDKTMFGGTKGKFNGLAYIAPDEGRPPEWQRRRPRKQPQENSNNAQRPYPVTPPYDPPYPRRSPPTKVPRQSDSDRRRGRDWVSNEVSSWFADENDYELDDEVPNISRRGRRRGSAAPWSPMNAIETFLGLDRERLSDQAEDYDRRLRRPKPRRRKDQPRRNGYSFDDSEAIDEDDFIVADERDRGTVIDTEAKEAVSEANNVEEEETQKELTWEERALAIERVPPADVPAWGPTGDLGVDARTRAISDALDDIQEARQKVDEKERRVEVAREEVSILRVDSEIERRKLENSRISSRLLQEELRRIDLEVDKAARTLRFATLQLKSAKENLSDLEARHWAVLSFYSPEKAEETIKEAFRELEEKEAAARRYSEKSSSTSSDQEKEAAARRYSENSSSTSSDQNETSNHNAKNM